MLVVARRMSMSAGFLLTEFWGVNRITGMKVNCTRQPLQRSCLQSSDRRFSFSATNISQGSKAPLRLWWYLELPHLEARIRLSFGQCVS